MHDKTTPIPPMTARRDQYSSEEPLARALAARIDRDIKRLKEGIFSFPVLLTHLDMLCVIARIDGQQVASTIAPERISRWESACTYWFQSSSCTIPHLLRDKQKRQMKKIFKTLSAV